MSARGAQCLVRLEGRLAGVAAITREPRFICGVGIAGVTIGIFVLLWSEVDVSVCVHVESCMGSELTGPWDNHHSGRGRSCCRSCWV